MGVRKIYHKIKPELERLNIKLGRDALFDLMASEELLIPKRKYRPVTTQSRHWLRKYPNLVKGLVPDGPNQVWVSDITYIRIKDGFSYLFLVSDAYSKKILGYCLSNTLNSTHAVNSLQDAIKNSCQPVSGLIHHSDRGIQYCSKEYIQTLKQNHIQVSMTEKGDPRENPIAERINGILKHEYLYDEIRKTRYLSTDQLEETIEKYNNFRPHLSCDMLTPNQAHLKKGILNRRWKNYYRLSNKIAV